MDPIWDELTKTADKTRRAEKWRKRFTSLGELVIKGLQAIDWESVAIFIGVMTVIVLGACLILAGIHGSNHTNDINEHKKEIQIEACKSAVNVDACLARLQ